MTEDHCSNDMQTDLLLNHCRVQLSVGRLDRDNCATTVSYWPRLNEGDLGSRMPIYFDDTGLWRGRKADQHLRVFWLELPQHQDYWVVVNELLDGNNKDGVC